MKSSSEPARRALNRVRMRQVALLLALQEQGTLSAAAREVGMTQPAASKMLRELEAALDCTLFERVSRRLKVTTPGRTTLLHFAAIRGALEALMRDLASPGGSDGCLAVGSIMAPSPTLLSQAVIATRQALPGLTVQITIDTSERLLERLEQGLLELVVGRLTEGCSRREYSFDHLAGESLAVVVGPRHPLARRRKVRLADLSDGPWVLPPRATPAREMLEYEFRLANLDVPPGRVETAAIFTTANLVLAGNYVAVLPASVASQFARHRMLSILPLPLGYAMEPYGTIVRNGRPLAAAARRFRSEIHAIARRDARPTDGRVRRIGRPDTPLKLIHVEDECDPIGPK